MGSKVKQPSDSEMRTRSSLQKCLVARANIKKGEFFSDKNLVAKRTGGVGISPIKMSEIFKMSARKDYKKDEIVFDE